MSADRLAVHHRTDPLLRREITLPEGWERARSTHHAYPVLRRLLSQALTELYIEGCAVCTVSWDDFFLLVPDALGKRLARTEEIVTYLRGWSWRWQCEHGAKLLPCGLPPRLYALPVVMVAEEARVA